MNWRTLSFGLIVLGSPNALAAQGHVWVVDDSGGADFTTIQAAIGAAGEGDIVLVKQGTYPQALGISGKSLTVQAEKGATVTVGQPNVSGPCSVTALTAAQNVRLRGLTLVVGLNVQNDQGTVWIEDCSITNGYSDLPALFAGSSASVVLIRTTAQGTGSNCTDGDYEAGSGLVLDGATVHAFGCTFKGGDGGTITKFIPPTTGCHAQQGGDGIRSLDVQDFLFLSDCTAKGGRGICTLHQSGVEHAMPGEGLNAAGTAEVFDSKLEGGPPGLESWQWFPDECTPPGAASSGNGVTVHPGRALRFTWDGPARENDAVALSFEGPPHVAVWIVNGPRVETLFSLAPFGSGLLGAPHKIDFVGITDDNGQLTETVQIPPLLPFVEGRAAFAQAFYLDPHPAGPLVGPGKIRHVPLRFVRGEGSMLVGLDESF